MMIMMVNHDDYHGKSLIIHHGKWLNDMKCSYDADLFGKFCGAITPMHCSRIHGNGPWKDWIRGCGPTKGMKVKWSPGRPWDGRLRCRLWWKKPPSTAQKTTWRMKEIQFKERDLPIQPLILGTWLKKDRTAQVLYEKAIGSRSLGAPPKIPQVLISACTGDPFSTRWACKS